MVPGLCPVKFTVVKGNAHFTGVGSGNRTGAICGYSSVPQAEPSQDRKDAYEVKEYVFRIAAAAWDKGLVRLISLSTYEDFLEARE
jgi:hypothetical protein